MGRSQAHGLERRVELVDPVVQLVVRDVQRGHAVRAMLLPLARGLQALVVVHQVFGQQPQGHQAAHLGAELLGIQATEVMVQPGQGRCAVGMPVLVKAVRGYASTVTEALARRDRTFTQTENANHRTDHAVVGGLVARVWRLSPTVAAAIRLHHDLYAIGEGRIDPDVHTLIAVGLVAELLMRRHEGLDPDADWHAHGAAALAWLHLPMQELLSWEEELRDSLDAL